MRPVTTTLVLLLFFSKAFGQNPTISTSERVDSLWIKQQIESQKDKQQDTEKNGQAAGLYWSGGQVKYSPDSSLRVGQIGASLDGVNIFHYQTIVQYRDRDRIVDLKLPVDTNHFDFQDYPVADIYKLPGSKNPIYLIISSKEELTNAPDEYEYPADHYLPDSLKFKKLYHVATLIEVADDSLKEIAFKLNNDTDSQKIPDIISSHSVSLDSYLGKAKHPFIPFLKYDPIKKEIHFLTTYCNDEGNDAGCPELYTNVYSGTFKYTDSMFTLAADSNCYYPHLESLDKTIFKKKFKTGNDVTKVVAVKKFEYVGEGVLSVLHVDYYVGSQNISYVDMLNGDETIRNLKPDYRAQKNSDLIFLITDSTTPHHDGRCGACEYNDSEFWLITQRKKQLLFTFSSSSEAGYPTYTYNDGKKNHNGAFYLEGKVDAGTPAEGGVNIDKVYWESNSTYVIRISDETESRNFYIRFVKFNKKTIARLMAGKLQRAKNN